MKQLSRKTFALAVLFLVFLNGCGQEEHASGLQNTGDALVFTGNIRAYDAGSQQGLQIDLFNRGQLLLYGPSVSVDLAGVGFFSEAKMYPYYGGNTSQANTIFPGEEGYVMLKLPNGIRVTAGQTIMVTLSPLGASNFDRVFKTVTVCKKGTSGCD